MEKYKVVRVGAGIAGMSAAINLKRAGINPLIIENNAPGGTLNYIPNIENYPGFESISGPDLAMNIYNQVNNLDIKIKSANISDIDLDKKIIDAEVIKPVLNSRCKWNNYGMFASDLRSICMIGERGALFFSDSFDDTNLYGYETESLKLSRQFEPINDL